MRTREEKYAKQREWTVKNKERLRAYNRSRYAADIENKREQARAKSLAYYYANREKVLVKNRARASTAEARKKARDYQLKKKFGISPEDYDQLLESQDGRCAICRRPDSRSRYKPFHVDHDHKTGKVRGLLCAGCNTGLGNLQDDPEVLLRAIAYLRRDNDDSNRPTD